MRYELHHAECLTAMRTLAPSSVDAIIADPPYLTTNLHFDKAPPMDWAAWWKEAWRVVKPAGVVVLFAADLFTVDLILTQRANYRYRLVWEKSKITGFLRANRQPVKNHEDVLVFGMNGNSSTYNPQKTPPTQSPRKLKRKQEVTAHYTTTARINGLDDGSRHAGSVLFFASPAGTAIIHPTEKPVPLLRNLIRTYTNPGDTVLDCFAGSGSTLEACLVEGRRGIGFERDATYFAKAQRRLQAIVAAPDLFAGQPINRS